MYFLESILRWFVFLLLFLNSLFPFLIDGYGDWSSDGCNTSSGSDPQVTCNCDHLTNFAILLVNMHSHLILRVLIY